MLHPPVDIASDFSKTAQVYTVAPGDPRFQPTYKIAFYEPPAASAMGTTIFIPPPPVTGPDGKIITFENFDRFTAGFTKEQQFKVLSAPDAVKNLVDLGLQDRIFAFIKTFSKEQQAQILAASNAAYGLMARGNPGEVYNYILGFSQDQQARIFAADNTVSGLCVRGFGKDVFERIKRFPREQQVKILAAENTVAGSVRDMNAEYFGASKEVFDYIKTFTKDQQAEIMAGKYAASELVKGIGDAEVLNYIKTFSPEQRTNIFSVQQTVWILAQSAGMLKGDAVLRDMWTHLKTTLSEEQQTRIFSQDETLKWIAAYGLAKDAFAHIRTFSKEHQLQILAKSNALGGFIPYAHLNDKEVFDYIGTFSNAEQASIFAKASDIWDVVDPGVARETLARIKLFSIAQKEQIFANGWVIDGLARNKGLGLVAEALNIVKTFSREKQIELLEKSNVRDAVYYAGALDQVNVMRKSLGLSQLPASRPWIGLVAEPEFALRV